MNDVTFIILGATGDLTKRKLIPAIYQLVKSRTISSFAIIGVARTRITAQDLLNASKPFISDIDGKVWEKMEQCTYYDTLDFDQKKDFVKLKNIVASAEKTHNLSGNKLFYLATLPDHFDTATVQLAESGIAHEKKECWSRVVYEKPFGQDLPSAKKINNCISRVFKESQVYRIDHYLGKELVGNIALVRFTNAILEPLWNNKHIESVQIVLSETLGVEGRGKFYDGYGAIKDMVQSHMLQILALVAMEPPTKLTGDYIRDEKVKVLKNLMVENVLVGQYEGYCSEKGVESDSNTETFTALKILVHNNRWKNVPFYLKTGKMLKKKESYIDVKFKMAPCLLLDNCPLDSNHLLIRIQPDEGFALELFAKEPGRENKISTVTMDFCRTTLPGVKSPEAYEHLLNQVIDGDQSVFVREDEIESAWKLVDSIKKGKLYSYPKGSTGPVELEEWNKKHGMRWRS